VWRHEGRDDAAALAVNRRVTDSSGESSQTVLIVDDDPRMRAYIRDLLDAESGFRILGEAKDGEEAIQLVQRLRPEVVLMDLQMPRMGGLDALRRTKREMPWTKVVMVTVHGEDAYRRAALALGADGFIVKKRLQGELLPVLRRIG
jgi:DNA-binding NarL/FixJ family response regulator